MKVIAENPKTPSKELLELNNEFNKVAEYEMNIQKSLKIYHTLIMNYQKEKLRKQSIYSCIKKNKTPGNKFNQKGERPVC